MGKKVLEIGGSFIFCSTLKLQPENLMISSRVVKELDSLHSPDTDLMTSSGVPET